MAPFYAAAYAPVYTFGTPTLLWLGLLLQERADRNLRENILAKCVVVAVEEISGHGDGFRVELDEQD